MALHQAGFHRQSSSIGSPKSHTTKLKPMSQNDANKCFPNNDGIFKKQTKSIFDASKFNPMDKSGDAGLLKSSNGKLVFTSGLVQFCQAAKTMLSDPSISQTARQNIQKGVENTLRRVKDEMEGNMDLFVESDPVSSQALEMLEQAADMAKPAQTKQKDTDNQTQSRQGHHGIPHHPHAFSPSNITTHQAWGSSSSTPKPTYENTKSAIQKFVDNPSEESFALANKMLGQCKTADNALAGPLIDKASEFATQANSMQVATGLMNLRIDFPGA